MNRRRVLAGMGLAAIVSPAFGMQTVRDQMPDEGFKLKYKVSLGDSHIGHQEVVISKHTADDHLIIEHLVDVEVRMLFAVVYSMNHQSTEVWTVDKRLVSVESKTIENGKLAEVAGVHKEDGLHILGEFGEYAGLDAAVTTDSFWIASALEAPAIINTRTGELAKPKISKHADGTHQMNIDFPHGSVVARLSFDGDFLQRAEIDSDGHIVKFERI